MPCGTAGRVATRSPGRLLLMAGKTKAGKKAKSGGKISKPALSWATAKPDSPTKSSVGQSKKLWALLLSGEANPKKVSALLRNGADVKHPDGEGYTLLHVACRAGLADVARCLIEAGADSEAVGGGG
eukprot:3822522-Prymnesium_polylepis.1